MMHCLSVVGVGYLYSNKYHRLSFLSPTGALCLRQNGRRNRIASTPGSQFLPPGVLRCLSCVQAFQPSSVPPPNTMFAFSLSTGTASLLRRSALLPSSVAVSAFPSADPACWPAAATRVRQSPRGAVVTRAMADGIKAPASADADDTVWREKLSPEQYRILRQKGTEMGGTGEYNKFTPAEGFFKVRLPGWGDMGRGGPGGMMTAARCLSNTSGRERQRECRRRPATSTGERRASSALPRS